MPGSILPLTTLSSPSNCNISAVEVFESLPTWGSMEIGSVLNATFRLWTVPAALGASVGAAVGWALVSGALVGSAAGGWVGAAAGCVAVGPTAAGSTTTGAVLGVVQAESVDTSITTNIRSANVFLMFFSPYWLSRKVLNNTALPRRAV